MIEQLQQISKTIPLSSSYSDKVFNTLTPNCPSVLNIYQSQPQQYNLSASLSSKTSKTLQSGIFQQFSLQITILNEANKHHNKSHDLSINLGLEQHVNVSNFNKFYSKKNREDLLSQYKTNKYNEFVDFDACVVKLMLALRDKSNCRFSGKEMVFTVDCGGGQWRFGLVPKQNSSFACNLSAAQTISLIFTLQYLQKIQSFYTESKPIQVDISLQQNEALPLKQKVHQLQHQLQKNTVTINQVIQQIKGIQKELYAHGRMIEVQENKIMKIIDDLQQINQGNQKIIKGSIKDKHGGLKKQVTVPDFLRERLSIDLHSSFLNKFEISGSLITYIGEDKEATQLLSNKPFSRNHKPHHLHSTLFIKKTQAKCIKFGVIDSNYRNQRSCWNFPHIVYLHGWGHTMVSKHEQDHSHCDFGTGSTVEMQADFTKGWIKWKVDGKKEVKLGDKEVGTLFSMNVEWVPFIAMYNYLDSVQWAISSNKQ